MGEGEAPHEGVRLLAGDQLVDRPHGGRDPGGLGREGRPAYPFVHRHHVVKEGLVIRTAQDEQPLRLGCAPVQLIDAVQRNGHVVLGGQVERRNCMAPPEGQFTGRMPGRGGSPPPAPIATTVATRESTSRVASAVQPPKLWPTRPTSSSPKWSMSRRTSGTRPAMMASI